MNTEAEIYANIRDKALEEAALIVERERGHFDYNDAAKVIRSLKKNPNA